MTWYQWISYGAFGWCLLNVAVHLIRLIRLGKPADFSTPLGEVHTGVAYSFTAGMSPKKKESAYLHLPTYAAGMIFHLGIFLSLLLYLVMLFYLPEPGSLLRIIPAVLLSVSTVCGLAILIKRFVSPLLRNLSNPDDYISNMLVTLCQLTLALYLAFPATGKLFWLISALLWLYFPLGKLKHAVYFFAARYHLGFFYGRRGVWPAPKNG
jgi:hypothetical protein